MVSSVRSHALTESGQELTDLLVALGTWGQKWLPRRVEYEDLDLELLLGNRCSSI